MNPLQRGFIPAPGVTENTVLLEAIIKRAKAESGELSVAFLDLAKAFDTVSHDLVRKGMERFQIPDHMVEVVMDMYHGATTSFTVKNGTSGPIRIGSGVRQGDPLSPILFDMALDPLFCLLAEEGRPWQAGTASVSAMGYADDTAVLSDSVGGMQENLRLVSQFCQEVGLQLNVRKSFAFHIKAGSKTFLVNQCEDFLVHGEPIPWVGPEETTKYLGQYFGPWRGLEKPQLKEKTHTWGKRVQKAPLKPKQKVEVWRSTILPRLASALQNTKASKAQLDELDGIARQYVRQALHLPDQVTVHLFYAPCSAGGLGLIELAQHVPRVDRKALMALHNSPCEHVKALAQALKVKVPEPLVRTDHVRLWSELPRQGKGAETWAGVPSCNFWLTSDVLSPAEFTAALQVRTNTYPTRDTIGLYASIDVRCRRCGLTNETIGHVSGFCPKMKRCRIKRHDSICRLFCQKATGVGWVVEWEPHFHHEDRLYKPDLVCVKGNRVVLVDPTVVWDEDLAALRRAKAAKEEKYKVLVEALTRKYSKNGSEPEVHIFGLPIGCRGGWIPENDEVLSTLRLMKRSTTKALTIRALGGTLRLLKSFTDGYF